MRRGRLKLLIIGIYIATGCQVCTGSPQGIAALRLPTPRQLASESGSRRASEGRKSARREQSYDCAHRTNLAFLFRRIILRERSLLSVRSSPPSSQEDW